MDKVLQMILVIIGIVGFIGIVLALTWGTDNGGWIHGKWLTKEHDCRRPSYFEGKDGDQWQCHKCKKVWNYKNHEWK